MVKTNLPVLLIRDMILFPYSEIRLEFDSENDKKLISLAESFYNNNILVVNPIDILEIEPTLDELPKLGVIGQIKMKIDLPNGKTRVIISGLNRARIHVYSKEDNIIEAMTSNILPEDLDVIEEIAYSRSLNKHIEVYVKEIPYMSNTILSQMAGITNTDKLTDIVSNALPVVFDRKLEYINETSSTTRVKMILDDINQDMEIIHLEEQIENEVNKKLEESQKEFVLREKLKVIKEELGEKDSKEQEINDLQEKIDNLKCSDKVRTRLISELNRYQACSPNSPEISMIKNYIDWLLDLPWDKRTKDKSDLKQVKKILDNTHSGLDNVKDRIIEYLAVKQNTNNLRSPIICLVGPPGVGKTTLAKSIADSINRKFTKISVGGINDEGEIVGHRRTYLGSAPGLIIQGMKKAGTMNPVFLIDEIDKLTKDIKGDPASSLLEVLDKEQNKRFMDHYIEEEFDLSEVLFVATANYIHRIPDELKDRLEIVELSSYTEYEKLDIAKEHLIKKQMQEHGLPINKVKFTDEALLTIIRNYTKESGVRELDRIIATILRKIVKDIVINKIRKTYLVDTSDLVKYLGQIKYSFNDNQDSGEIGVVNAMAYTPFGGDILPIEASFFKGTGNLILTGSLGEVMKESATLALSYIKANCKNFGIKEEQLTKTDIHIHVPDGSIPKDGPSAGVALTTSLISLFTNQKVSSKISMSGELTLRGKVLAVGSIKEKVIGAHRACVKKIFLPKDNERDLLEIPEYIKKDIEFILVDKYTDIFNNL